MHELGIVFHIMDGVRRAAADAGAARVSEVTLELGEVSGIIAEYLESCWRWACEKDDMMRGCSLVIEKIGAITLCESCGQTYETVAHGRICPHCASERTYLLQGNEVIIKEIAVPDDA